MGEPEVNAMLAAMPKGKREDEDGNSFDVVMYEDYVAMVAR